MICGSRHWLNIFFTFRKSLSLCTEQAFILPEQKPFQKSSIKSFCLSFTLCDYAPSTRPRKFISSRLDLNFSPWMNCVVYSIEGANMRGEERINFSTELNFSLYRAPKQNHRQIFLRLNLSEHVHDQDMKLFMLHAYNSRSTVQLWLLVLNYSDSFRNF